MVPDFFLMNSPIKTDAGLAIDVTIRLPNGLHSRPSARLAQTARQFVSDVFLVGQEGEVDAKSMLDILSLALKTNDCVRVVANGPDASEALLAVQKILLDSGG